MILIRIGIYKITQFTITFEISEEMFKEGSRINSYIIAHINSDVCFFMGRLCLKDVSEGMIDVKQILLIAEIIESELLGVFC